MGRAKNISLKNRNERKTDYRHGKTVSFGC